MMQTRKGMRGAQDVLRRIAVGLAVGLAGALSTGQAGASDCAGLAGLVIGDSTITSATVVTPPTTIGGAVVTVPLCRVQGEAKPSLDSLIKFEVWLPPTAADWTGRMKVNGTGGYAGAIPYARLA